MESHRSYGLKKQDAFSEIVIVDPITLPIARVLATLKVHPITVTIFAFLARLIAAGFFIYGFGAYGAISSIIGFFLDGIDGKIARLRQLDEELHGTVDFLMDQVAFGAMGVGALIWAVYAGYRIETILLGLWLSIYMILMAFTSTWYRILSQHNKISSRDEGEKIFQAHFRNGKGGVINAILKMLDSVYARLKDSLLKKYHIIPYPTAIESEVLVFMIAPFFHFHPILLSLGILCLFPDIFIYFILNLMKVLNPKASE